MEWNGMEWNGMEWNGMRTGMNDRSKSAEPWSCTRHRELRWKKDESENASKRKEMIGGATLTGSEAMKDGCCSLSLMMAG